MKKNILILIFIFFTNLVFAQGNLEVYPTHWWVGMKTNKVQLIVHEKESNLIIAVDKLVVKSSSPDVKIVNVNRVENKRYIFIDIAIAPKANPQTVKISFGGIAIKEWRQFNFEIKAKEKGNGVTRVQGVSSADLVYLLMPDRFTNGDTTNDFFVDMNDSGHDRNNPFDRHGGDLQGVTNQLDYLKDLGATAIWMTPVVENNMSRTTEGGSSRSTYHGYAFTNQYQIDKRFGGNEAYKNLVNIAHKKGLKIVQDAVYNHIGNDHFLFKDLPAKDFLNQWPVYQNTSYKDQPLVDPYAAIIDKKIASNGWFTPFLVDLNQRNPYVEKYLIQYALWATQEFGIDGWRVDTYFYSDEKFLNKINDALLNEFPTVTVFGEAWVQSVTNSAYFCQNNINVPFKHNLQGVTDFPFLFAAIDAFNQPFGWNDGVSKLYQTLAQDILYKNPMRNCIFLGNHDLDRIYSVFGEDLNKMKAAHTLLLTQRGIPQIYYGDEVLMKNFKNPTDAEVRKDFEGGWTSDVANKFVAAGRNTQENDFFNYLKTLANFRKQSPALKNGKLMQFLPQDGVYVYFRYTNEQTVMIVINTNKNEKEVTLDGFKEKIAGFNKYKNVITKNIEPLNNFILSSYETRVMELAK